MSQKYPEALEAIQEFLGYGIVSLLLALFSGTSSLLALNKSAFKATASLLFVLYSPLFC